MAATRQCLGVDIGNHSIRVAEVAVSSGGVNIRRMAEARLELEAGMKEAERQSAIVNQLNALLKEHKFKVRTAVFSVPGQTVFVRRLRVPATTPERLHRIIRFEAREQIPFPLEKTIIEYQVFEGDDPGELEVLLVAIKREYIDNFMRLVRKTPLKPLAVSVSSLALHNFHEFNGAKTPTAQRLEKSNGAKKAAGAKKDETAEEGEKEKAKKGKKSLADSLSSLPFFKKKKKAETEVAEVEQDEAYDAMEMEEIQAQINLGATTLDLAIPKAGAGRLIGFTRSVPVAGAQIDKSIRKKLNLESINEARRIKEEEAVVLAQDFEISGDPESVNMPASEAATSVADAIIAEIRRSLDFFISQPDGAAVDSFVLSGGLSRLSYLSNYIEEKMGMPVELASIKNEEIQYPEDMADAVSTFVIPIGLALQGVGVSQIDIDFLPEEIKNIRAFKKKKAPMAVSTGLLALIIFLSMQVGNSYIQDFQRVSQEYDRLIRTEGGQGKRVQELIAENTKLFDQYKKITEARSHRYFLVDFMKLFIDHRPPAILVESLGVGDDGNVTVRGLTPRRAAISELLSRLNESENPAIPIYEPELVSIRTEGVEDPRFRSKVFPFQLQMGTARRDQRIRSVKYSFGRPEKGAAPTSALPGTTGGASPYGW